RPVTRDGRAIGPADDDLLALDAGAETALRLDARRLRDGCVHDLLLPKSSALARSGSVRRAWRKSTVVRSTSRRSARWRSAPTKLAVAKALPERRACERSA